jgi:hypothetical protein
MYDCISIVSQGNLLPKCPVPHSRLQDLTAAQHSLSDSRHHPDIIRIPCQGHRVASAKAVQLQCRQVMDTIPRWQPAVLRMQFP